MDYIGFSQSYLIQCSTKITQVEGKLTDEQIEYLHQYYAINQHPSDEEFEEIAKQWNKDDFRFLWDLDRWFFCHRIIDQAVEDQRQALRWTAA